LEKVVTQVLKKEDQLVKGMKWTNVIAQGLGATDGSGRGLFAYTGNQGNASYNYRIDTRDTISCRRIRKSSEVKLAITPNATEADELAGLLTFIPDAYDDDLEYLIADLIHLCAGDLFAAPVTTSTLDARTRDLVNKLADQVGHKKFSELLARWTLLGEGAMP
jgi:hypothetical protein